MAWKPGLVASPALEEGRLCHRVHPIQWGLTGRGRCCGWYLAEQLRIWFLSCQRGVSIRVSTSMAALSIRCVLALALHWGPLVLEKCPVSQVTCRLSQVVVLWVELCLMLWGSFFLSLLTGITVMCVTVW